MTTLFFVLFMLIWLMALAVIGYLYFYHEKQRKVLRYIALQLKFISQNFSNLKSDTISPLTHEQDNIPPTLPKVPEKKPETSMTIDKNDPISKYENMTLPDEVDVKFK